MSKHSGPLLATSLPGLGFVGRLSLVVLPRLLGRRNRPFPSQGRLLPCRLRRLHYFAPKSSIHFSLQNMASNFGPQPRAERRKASQASRRPMVSWSETPGLHQDPWIGRDTDMGGIQARSWLSPPMGAQAGPVPPPFRGRQIFASMSCVVSRRASVDGEWSSRCGLPLIDGGAPCKRSSPRCRCFPSPPRPPLRDRDRAAEFEWACYRPPSWTR